MNSTSNQRIRVSALLFFTCLISSIAFGQTATKSAAASWLVQCNNAVKSDMLVCAMSQRILDAKSRQQIIAAKIISQNNNLRMTISLPHGISIQSGATVSVDKGKALLVPVESADSKGAYASLLLTETHLSTLKEGNIMKIGVTAVGGKAIVFELPLSGFSQSLKLLRIGS